MSKRVVLGLGLLAWAACSGDDGAQRLDESVDKRDAGGQEQADGSATQDAAPDEGDASVADGGLCSACGDCAETIRVTSARHSSAPIDYPDLPPARGDHAQCWTRYGVHTEEKPDEVWVHNLEHGAVVFLYRCPAGCPAELTRLQAIAANHPFAIVMPYAALPKQFAVVSWGHRLVSECFDETAFTRFYDEHANQAPESITSDGSC